MGKKEWIESWASKCMQCEIAHCKFACPLQNDIPNMIKQIKDNNYKKAYEILCQTTIMPAICGRICPHERQCEGGCSKCTNGHPVKIGNLETFIGMQAIKNNWELPQTKKINKKVAVIGAGPAGLTCAAFLAMNGVDVTIYEKHNYLGGLLKHGIPDFRLKKETLNQTLNKILKLPIKIKYNMSLGGNLYLEDLKKEYHKIFISIGANEGAKMNINGENLQGVYSGNELLEYKNHPKYKNKTVMISGGGNVAMDTARTIKRLGARNVTIVYRRDEKNMSADSKEIEAAKRDGVLFQFKTNIKQIKGKNKVESICCTKNEIRYDENGKCFLEEIENSNFSLKCNYVVMSVGSKTEEIVKTLGLEIDENQKIKVDSTYKTGDDQIYSGGDVTHTIATVAWAAKTGREAAKNIIKSFQEEKQGSL